MKSSKQSSAVRTQPAAFKAGFRQFPERASGASSSTSGRESNDETDPTEESARLKQTERLCFDRDIAEQVGVNAALLVKYVECSIRGKHAKKPDTGNWMWDPRVEIAQALALSVDQVETAAKKAKQAKILRIRRNQHYDKTNKVLFYGVVDEPAFFKSRSRATPYWMRRDEFVELGACAAVLLHSFRYWQDQNSTVEGAHFEGRTWHHDDLRGLAEVYAGLFTARQIEDTLNRLVKVGRLLRRPYDPDDGRNPSRWFAVNDTPKSTPLSRVHSVTEAHQTQDESEARQIPNGSTSNPPSEHAESQLHNTDGTRTDALRAALAPLGQPSALPKTNLTLRLRPSVAPQAAGASFENEKAKQNLSEQDQGEDLSRDSDSLPDVKIIPASETSQKDQPAKMFAQSSKEPRASVVPEAINLVDAQNGSDSVDLRYDTKQQKLRINDREGNVRETFAQCHREVFGCNPSHGLGQARPVLSAAQTLKISVRLYCLVSMVSWHLTNPDKPFPSQSLVGDNALDRVKLWIDQCLEKFGGVDEHLMGLLFDQDEVQGRVDWRQPEHPYKAILRHWTAEYHRFSEAEYEANQDDIEQVIDWISEHAPQARSLRRFSDAPPKLKDALDLITLNFEVAEEPYLTPQEFFTRFVQIREKLSSRLRAIRTKVSASRRFKSKPACKDAPPEQATVSQTMLTEPKPMLPGTRRAGAPVPPPQLRPASPPTSSDTLSRAARRPVPPPRPVLTPLLRVDLPAMTDARANESAGTTTSEPAVPVDEMQRQETKKAVALETNFDKAAREKSCDTGQAAANPDITRQLMEVHDDDGDMVAKLVAEGFVLDAVQDFFSRSGDLANLYFPTYEEAKAWLAAHPDHTPLKSQPRAKTKPLWRQPSQTMRISQDRAKFEAASLAARREAIECAEATYRRAERIGTDVTEARANWLRLQHWQESLTAVADD